MNGIVVFSPGNDHPMAWLLNNYHRHVWCAIRDDDRGYWISYNWHHGLPIVICEAEADFDLANYYRSEGMTVIEVERGNPILGPIMMNNCVGHVKLMMGIRSWALTPYQLFRHLTKEKAMFERNIFSVPGFAGGSPAAPPPPPPPPERSDEEVRAAAREQRRISAQAKGRASTILTSGQGVTDEVATKQKKLLGE